MFLESLRLYHFRNHDERTFTFSPGVNAIFGPNGSGKTNILEAMVVLSTGRSPRSLEFKETISWGQQDCALKGVARSKDRRRTELELRFAKRKELFLNQKLLERSEELWGELPLLFCHPLSGRIIWDEASHRRRFLNSLLIQYDKDYKTQILRYNQVLAERNAGLKRIRAGGLVPGTQAVWDEALAEGAVSVMKKRQDLIKSLNQTAPGYYNEIADGECLTVSYEPSVSPVVMAQGAGAFLKELRQKYDVEIALGTTVIGPHRDELDLAIDSKAVRHFASQGQQRSVVLALYLAGRDILAERLGDQPLCLYDDVFSELDGRRRQRLWDLIAGSGQSFLTSVEFTAQEKASSQEISLDWAGSPA